MSVPSTANAVRSRRTRSGFGAALAVCAYALAVHAAQRRGMREYEQWMVSRGAPTPRLRIPQWRQWFELARTILVGPVATFALAGVALARAGRWRLAALPAIAWCSASLLAGDLGVRAPTPLTGEWYSGWLAPADRYWTGAACDIGLIVAIAFAFRRARRATAPTPTAPSLWAAVVAGAVALALVANVTDLLGYSVYSGAALLVPLVGFALLGALGGRAGVFAGTLVALTAPGHRIDQLPFELPELGSQIARDTTPLLLALLIGAAIPVLARTLAAGAERPLHLLVACNALNAADALLTATLLGIGAASEANPVVRVIGLPAKVILVALASLWIYRLRPRALIWPTAALGTVLVWHALGIAAGTPTAWA